LLAEGAIQETPIMRTSAFILAAVSVLIPLAPAFGQAEAPADRAVPAEGAAAKAAPMAKPAEAQPVSEVEARRAEELFEDGRKLFFQGDYPKAVARLAEAAAANPAKTSYKLLLAKAHRYAAQPEKAAAVLEEILAVHPEHVEAAVELAELLTPARHADRVIGILEPLLKFKHDYPVYHLLAEAHYQKENFDSARKYYEEAANLNPQSARDHYQLGNIYLAQKRFAKAATAYETAGRLGTSSGVYHFKLASVYFNLHNYLGNVTTAEVIGGTPGEIKNEWFLLDPVPGQKDRFYVAGPRSAVYQVAKAQQAGIDIFEIRFLEANIWLAARRFARADLIYKKIEEKVPKTEAGLFWFSWAQTSLGLDDYDAYLARVNKAIEVQPDVYKGMLADALVMVAVRYQQRGENDKYVEYLGRAVATNPLSASLHLTLGDAHWFAGEQSKAIEQYKLVLELEPDHRERIRLLNRIRGQEETATAARPTG
jgi:tetratricopeptide (TPR) repeat protein